MDEATLLERLKELLSCHGEQLQYLVDAGGGLNVIQNVVDDSVSCFLKRLRGISFYMGIRQKKHKNL